MYARMAARGSSTIRLRERLVDNRFVRHVVGEHHFTDGYKFYRFAPSSN